MGRSFPLDAALKRLTGALDRLEAASGRLDHVGVERRDLADALAAMEDDRARLAEDLNEAVARARLMERATEEVASRLGRAGAVLRRLVVEDASTAPADGVAIDEMTLDELNGAAERDGSA